MKELKLSGKTAAGKPVSVDYVGRSLEHLKELYKGAGDDIAFKNADDLLKKAETTGLTRLEVNNLSRQYGIEFGEKAFSKLGEARTTVNAVKFENTRGGLKAIARQGLGGKAAQEADKSISSLYRVNDLVKKNVEAVNRLQQRVQGKGLLEKFGYQAVKAVDVLSGGSLRGIVGGLLPRGVGYKIMNALDLEQTLKSNLEIIQKALKAKDADLMKLLKSSTTKSNVSNVKGVVKTKLGQKITKTNPKVDTSTMGLGERIKYLSEQTNSSKLREIYKFYKENGDLQSKPEYISILHKYGIRL